MIIRPIKESDIKGGFSCGEPALDTFFNKRAWTHEQAHVSRVYVLVDETDEEAVLGFYTLSAKEVERDRLREALRGSYPKYPLPVFYIGYFAVSKEHHGRGLGRRLMADALRRCAAGAESVGAVGVFLDAVDDKSTTFYRRLGFVALPRAESAAAGSPQPMFLPMKTILAAVGGK